MRAAVVTCLVVLGCSGGPKQVGTQPSWRDKPVVTAQKPVTFAPVSQSASRYNEPPTPPPHTPLADAVIAAVNDAARVAGKPSPVADGRLFRACEELAEVVPEEGIVSYGLVEFALQRNGIIEPSPNLLVVWGDARQPAAIVEQLAPRFAEMFAEGSTARVGIGAVKRLGDGASAIVFALQSSGVTTAPFPRSLAAGASFTLDATIDVAHYRDPELFVTRDDGTTDRVDLKPKAGVFSAAIACSHAKGREQVEITASGTTGSTVLANFPIYCGQDPPVAITVAPSRDDAPVTTREEAELRLLQLINRDRSAASLPALVADDRDRDVARAHSDEMRRTKIVAHVSPTTGSAADRVHAANIRTAVVLENVARAYGVGEAHQGLMNSPGHRANIMSRQATAAGIGVVFGDEVSGRREVFITQVFTRVPPKVDPVEAAKTIASRIDAARKVVVNAKLAAIAADAAAQLATGKTREAVWPDVRRRVDALGGLYSRIGSVVTAAADLEAVDGKDLLGDAAPDEIGVGVAQGPHPEIGEGAMWIVVLMADKR